MAKNLIEGGPSEGELVVCSVKDVKQNGAYVILDEYESVEGFIFIGEIASGWVKNIRGFVREGQRLICKVMRTRRDGRTLELSLKSVSEERKRDRLQQWKNEERAKQLIKVLGEKVGWSDEERVDTQEELAATFVTLYGAFEEAATTPEAITESGFEGDWIKDFIEIAIENIIPPFVEIRGRFTLTVNGSDGIETIKTALLAAEEHSDKEAEIEVACYYDGAPSYRIELRAPDFKSGEDIWEKATKACIDTVMAAGGSAEAERE